MAFNCYLASVPAAFAHAPLDSQTAICSAVSAVEHFEAPAAQLWETRTAEGFERWAPEAAPGGWPMSSWGWPGHGWSDAWAWDEAWQMALARFGRGSEPWLNEAKDLYRARMDARSFDASGWVLACGCVG